jgi:hypothetical protein
MRRIRFHFFLSRPAARTFCKQVARGGQRRLFDVYAADVDRSAVMPSTTRDTASALEFFLAHPPPQGARHKQRKSRPRIIISLRTSTILFLQFAIRNPMMPHAGGLIGQYRALPALRSGDRLNWSGKTAG